MSPNKTGLLLLFLAIFLAQSAFGQRKKKTNEYKWPQSKPRNSTIPDSLKGEDAVMVFQYKIITHEIVDLANWRTRTTESVRSKIKIQTPEGLEYYSKLLFRKSPEFKLDMLDARVIKPSGEIVNLSRAEIKKLDYRDSENLEESLEELRFFIPNVEIGDDVEMIYTISRPSLKLAKDVFFHSHLPTLTSTITIVSSKVLNTQIRQYNGPGKPQKTEDLENFSFFWKVKGLRGFDGHKWGIPKKELPYLTYAIRSLVLTNGGQTKSYPLVANNWAEIRDAYDNTFSDKELMGRPEAAYFDTYMQRVVKRSKEGHPNNQAKYVFSSIIDSLEITELMDVEANNPSGYFLMNEQIDNRNLHILYRNVFKYLKVPYKIGLARSRYQGRIDGKFISPHSISHVFYMFLDSAGYRQYLFPGNIEKKYYLNEIPWVVQGTQATFYEGNDNSPNPAVTQLKLVKDEYSKTFTNTTGEINIDLETNKTTGRFREILNGTVYSWSGNHYDYLVDYGNEEELTKEFGFVPDSLEKIETSNVKPFRTAYSYTLKESDLLTSIDDSTLTLNLQDFLSHNPAPENDAEVCYLDYYSRFRYFETNKRFVRFSQPVKLLNQSQLKISETKDFGAFTLSVEQLDETTILVESSYQLKKMYIPKQQYHELVELNTALEEASKLKIAIGVR